MTGDWELVGAMLGEKKANSFAKKKGEQKSAR